MKHMKAHSRHRNGDDFSVSNATSVLRTLQTAPGPLQPQDILIQRFSQALQHDLGNEMLGERRHVAGLCRIQFD